MDEFSVSTQETNLQTPPRNPEHRVSMVLGTFILFCLFGASIGAGLTILLGKFYGLDPADVAGALGENATPSSRDFVRWMLTFSHLFTFILPGAVTVWLFYGNLARFSGHSSPLQYLKAARWPSWFFVGAGILLLLVSLPLVHYLFGLNKMLPLPDWMRQMESDTNDAIKGLLKMDSPLEMLANVAVMALIPVIGEELVFRGIVQQQLMRRLTSPIVAILVASAIFSAIHMQFEGFFPRMLLGFMLGWLFWKTGNLWVAVAAHFFNNAVQVVGQFLYGEEISTIDLEQEIDVPWFVAAVSVFLVWVSMRMISGRKTLESGEPDSQD